MTKIEIWKKEFQEQPQSAVNSLLLREADIGEFGRNETSDIFFNFFKTAEKTELELLDRTILEWISNKFSTSSEKSISSKRWAEIIEEAFLTIDRLNLNKTINWLLDNYYQLRLWLRSFYISQAFDPEYAFLRTLALHQRDERLLPLWFGLCKMIEDLPVYYSSLGLLGLRKIPTQDGKASGDIPSAFFSGMIQFADALHNISNITNAEKKKLFLSEFALLCALFPRSKSYWLKNFLKHEIKDSIAKVWLSEKLPNLRETGDTEPNIKNYVEYLRTPMPVESDKIIKVLLHEHLTNNKSILIDFFIRHREYVKQTGEAKYLSKSYTNIGNIVRRKYFNLSYALLKDAFYLTSSLDPFVWTNFATLETQKKDFNRAIGLLFKAKRKFPENVYIRNILATILQLQQYRNEDAELLYRQTIAEIPSNEYCRVKLIAFLKQNKKYEEAENVCREAMKHFPKNKFFSQLLAKALFAQHDNENKLQEAEQIFSERTDSPREKKINDLGLVITLAKQNKIKETVAKIESITHTVRDEKIIKTLESIKGGDIGKDKIEIIEKHFNKLSKEIIDEEIKKRNDLVIEDEDFLLQEEELPIIKENPKELIREIIQEAKIGNYPKLFSDDEIRIDEEIGLAELYLFASRNIDNKYINKANKHCDNILKKHPNQLSVLLEKGWLLLEQKDNKAEEFFLENKEKFQNVLGFHIGYLRTKVIQEKRITDDNWDDLITKFRSRDSIIRLENAFMELENPNGRTLQVLENLRKRTSDNDRLQRFPLTMRENEEWIIRNIREKLFVNINLTEPIDKSSIDICRENYFAHKEIFKGVVEECLANF